MEGQACQDSLEKSKDQERVRASQASQASQVKAKKRAMAGQGFQDILDQAYLDTQGLVYLVTQDQAFRVTQDQAIQAIQAQVFQGIQDLDFLDIQAQGSAAFQGDLASRAFLVRVVRQAYLRLRKQDRLQGQKLHACKARCSRQKCCKKGKLILWQR